MDKLPEDGSDWVTPDVAWQVFAGVILGLLGVFNVIEGLLTLFNDRYGGQIGAAFFFFNLKGWGWLHLLLGLALLAVAAGLLMGMEWAPSIAVGLAGATAIFSMIYVNIIPTWSWINVALAILIIFILIIKNRETLGVRPPAPATLDEAPASANGDVEP
ncbi:MAG TPA: hypothetical protein VF062_02235 [Candidatus Limnocylindrales bacterium]